MILISFVDKLVCPCDKREIVDMAEFIGYFVTK